MLKCLDVKVEYLVMPGLDFLHYVIHGVATYSHLSKSSSQIFLTKWRKQAFKK